jgi:hypothetical protein
MVYIVNIMDIDKRLTEMNIHKLINDNGVPFSDITDGDISRCLQVNILLTTNAIYNSSNDCYSYKNNKTYDVLKIATIVNEINNNTYNYNYPIVVYEDNDNGTIKYDADGNGLYHIRAFYYCNKNMHMMINHCD